MENKKILIIGGCGFIGSALVEKYYKNNEIHIFDNCAFEESALSLRKIQMDNIKIIQGDATDFETITSLDKDYDYIIHASAVLGIRKVTIESKNTIMTNFNSCYNALELATMQTNLSKFLTFSTSEVYGIKTEKPNEEQPTVIEQAKESRWCYAASKVLSEHLAYAYNRESNVPIIIIRPFNVFGEYRKGSNAMTTFLNRAMDNEDIIIDGDGQQVRAWCHIEDFIKGICNALESSYNCETFNIGNPYNEITIEKLAEKVIEMTNSNSKIQITNSTEPDVRFRSVCIEKAEKMLNYKPGVSIDEGIKRVFYWMKEEKKNG